MRFLAVRRKIKKAAKLRRRLDIVLERTFGYGAMAA